MVSSLLHIQQKVSCKRYGFNVVNQDLNRIAVHISKDGNSGKVEAVLNNNTVIHYYDKISEIP